MFADATVPMDKLDRMNKKTKVIRMASVASLILGLISFICLVMYYLALTDIWHESGSPDFWKNEGPCAFEWRFLTVCFWPMLIFHVVFFITAVILARNHITAKNS